MRVQAKSIPTSLTFSPSGTHFSTLSLPDRQIRIFSFLTGKKTRQYDESLQAIQEMQQAGTAVFRMDDMEFGRRLAVERELEKVGQGIGTTAWDETGGFLLYPTMLGIKGESGLASLSGWQRVGLGGKQMKKGVC